MMQECDQQEPHSDHQLRRIDDIGSLFSLDSLDFSISSSTLSPAYHSLLSMSPVAVQLPAATKPLDGKDMVSVSSAFFPGSHKLPSDTIFRSSDSVLFYIHYEVVLKASRQAFEGFLKAPMSDQKFRDVILDVPEHSSILNILLHAIYGLSCAKHSPDLADLEKAVERMPLYGLPPKPYMLPDSPLFDIFLSHAPINPIRVYALAGRFDAYELAEKTSSHLLSYKLPELTDALAIKIGAVYLRRLMILHISLVDTLKIIMLQPPAPHSATQTCNFIDQKKLSRAWALAASYLAWDSRPDLSIHQMQNTLMALGDHLDCDQCKEVLKIRVKEVVIKWVNVKVDESTIPQGR